MNRRLLITIAAAVGLLWLAGAAASALLIRHEVDEVFDSALQETAQRLLPLVTDDLKEQSEREGYAMPRGGDASDEHEDYILYQVRASDGRVLLRSHDAPETAFPAPLTAGYFYDGSRRIFTEWSADRSLAIQVAELPKERLEAQRGLWLGLLMPLLVVLPIAAMAVHRTVHRTTAPLERFGTELAGRDGSNLAPIDGRGLPLELMPMVADVNRLLARLSAALEAEREVASNSAHELRNPLAAAQAQAGLVASELTDPDQRRRAAGVVSALATLSRRVETMLQLARAESGFALARDEMSLTRLVMLVVEDWQRRPATGSRIVFHNTAVGPLIVWANADAIAIAVQNLIANAIRHGAPDTQVEIRLGSGPELSVVNAGEIVPAGDLARLKQRFARASNGAREGSGLGLYIADAIAAQSGARLDLYSPARGSENGFEAVLRWG